MWCNFLQVLCKGRRWVHGHLPWHKSHQGGSDSGWYCHFPVHLSWTRYNIGRNSLQHVLKEGGGRSDQTRDSTSNKGCRPGTGSFYRASLNPSDYGWTLGVHGYEPVPTLDPMAPEGVLKFTSCNCHGDCSNQLCTQVVARRMGSCARASQPVESAKALHAKTAVMMLLSLKIDNDSWSFWHWGWDINNSEYYICKWNKSYFLNVKVSVAFFKYWVLCCVWNIYMPTNQLKITRKNWCDPS